MKTPAIDSGCKRRGVFARLLVLTALMLPLIIGCSSGKNNPIDPGQNVSAEPGDTLYQGYTDQRYSTSSHEEERGYKSPYLEIIGPAEIVEYEYDIKVTNLQLPVFQAQLYNFNSPLDVSMFSCIVDYTDVKPILNEYESIVEFSPLEPLHDGRHEAWISFSGGTSFTYTGVTFNVVTEPPVITNIMLQPETRTVRICFDRQVESKDATNVNNWLLSGISGIFNEATMYPYGAGTQVLIKVAEAKNLIDYAPGGLSLTFRAKEGNVEGNISEGALFGWDNHGGESETPGNRIGQAGLCENCAEIQIGSEHWEHISKEHEQNRVAYEIASNPDHCPMAFIETMKLTPVANEPFYEENNQTGSFWRNEDSWSTGESSVITEGHWYIAMTKAVIRKHLTNGGKKKI